MAGRAIRAGERATIMPSASRAAGTAGSFPFRLLGGARGMVISLLPSSYGAAGQIDTVIIQEKIGDTYITVATFDGLAKTSGDAFLFSMGAGMNDYTAAIADQPPTIGRVRIVHSANAMIYKVKVENVS